MNTTLHKETLELDKILKLLAKKTRIEAAKEMALNLEPKTDIGDVKELLGQTDDAYKLIASFGSPSFGSAKDMSNALARAEAGGVLTMRELLDIGEVLRTVRSLCDWRTHCENSDSPHIDGFFSLLTPNKYFEERIFASIKTEYEMDDNASLELKNIRRKIHSAELNVRDRLEKTVRSSNSSKFLQEAIITQRDGRYCIPVKAEYRAEVPGLLHDTSSSGATLFIEPMAVVEINNQIRELFIKEKEEIDRILAELSRDATGFAPNIKNSFYAVCELSLIFAKASLAFDMMACKPSLNDCGRIHLKNARHPLLDRKTVVPVTIPLGTDFDTLIITGPNTGGKTVTIKTVGLLTLMTMCGMMIPVSDGSEISVFNNILADIGDEQSIEQSLSTFSAHMTKIVSILNLADKNSLVLIDELGAGTDPVEGAALATAILLSLREKGAKIAATTHYAELKSFALETDGVCNASCEFDVATLKPTYKLIVGLPGRSNAFAISRRLGLSEQIVETAKSLVTEENTRFERIVGKLEDTVKEAEKNRNETARLKGEIERLKSQQSKKLQEAENLKAKALENAKEQAEIIISRTRAEAEKMLAELETLRKSNDSAEERIRRARAAVKGGTSKMHDTADPILESDNNSYTLPRPLKKGDRVIIAHLKTEAEVLEDQSGEQILILAGIMKTKISVSDLRLVEKHKAKPPKSRTVRKTAAPEKTVRTASTEIDIRGFTGDEAALELDRFIDNSVMAGLSTVWIIHGKGTGALKKAVREYLKNNQSVKNFRSGVYGEGEDGVTVAELK
jgi:DNA mismatch repair protein MutS2